jgi:hypothetical protein
VPVGSATAVAPAVRLVLISRPSAVLKEQALVIVVRTVVGAVSLVPVKA